jgi:hypothetical protein
MNACTSPALTSPRYTSPCSDGTWTGSGNRDNNFLILSYASISPAIAA